MNTKPDDTTLAMWLDDELEGEEHARVEAWAAEHPEQLAAREEIRRWRDMIREAVPAEEPPPAAEFFNERIQQAIRQPADARPATNRSAGGRAWPRLWMPLAACAGMAMAFWLGMITPASMPGPGSASTTADREAFPVVYTPEQGVEADYFTSSGAAATVIVLSGVNAIPDAIDFRNTAATQRWDEIDSTAVTEPTTPGDR